MSTISQPSATLAKAITEIRRLAGIDGISISLELLPLLPALLREELTILTLPRELRDQILSLLLINPDLGRISSVDSDSNGGYGTNLQYGLDPTILRVCRQLYTEGEKLLYGQKIYIGCIGGSGRMCPLTRYLDPCSQREPLRKIPAALKVQNWLAVANSDGGGVNVPSWQFKDFCRTVALSTPRLVEVALLPKGILGDIEAVYPEASKTLSPLKILRNVEIGSVKIRDATVFEIPCCFGLENMIEFTSHLDTDVISSIEEEFTKTGQPYVERLEEMLSCILEYAQCFELCEAFKKDMATAATGNYHQINHFNPFWGRNIHPVEQALKLAAQAVKQDDIEAFREQRDTLLTYLEKQYQAAAVARENLVKFVKGQMHHQVLFDPSDIDFPYYSEDQIYDAMGSFLSYANCLYSRDIPPEIMAQIAKTQTKFDRIYSSSERSALVSSVKWAFEMDEWETLPGLYRDAVDHLDEQFLSMRKARQLLFNFDLGGDPEVISSNDRGCNIDPDFSGSTDKIDWTLPTEHSNEHNEDP